MPFDCVSRTMNGNKSASRLKGLSAELQTLDADLKKKQDNSAFHGDSLLADKVAVQTGLLADLKKVLAWKNVPEIMTIVKGALSGKSPDVAVMG